MSRQEGIMSSHSTPRALAIACRVLGFALLALPALACEAGAQARSGTEEIRTETARAEARLTMPMLRKLLPAKKRGVEASESSCDKEILDSLGFRKFIDACPVLKSEFTSAGFSTDEVVSALASLGTAYLHIGAEMAAKEGFRAAPDPPPPGVRRDNIDLVRANFDELSALE
jgi:hypothetical protein